MPLPETSVTARPDPTSAEPSRPQRITVYLVREDRLVATDRAPGPDADRLTTSLQTLVRATDDAERARGLRSAVPPDTAQPAWRGNADELLIELPTTFDALTAHEQVLAIGQLVYTATENSTADHVGFFRDDKPVAVPDGAGRLLTRPVTRQDYRQVGPG